MLRGGDESVFAALPHPFVFATPGGFHHGLRVWLFRMFVPALITALRRWSAGEGEDRLRRSRRAGALRAPSQLLWTSPRARPRARARRQAEPRGPAPHGSNSGRAGGTADWPSRGGAAGRPARERPRFTSGAGRGDGSLLSWERRRGRADVSRRRAASKPVPHPFSEPELGWCSLRFPPPRSAGRGEQLGAPGCRLRRTDGSALFSVSTRRLRRWREPGRALGLPGPPEGRRRGLRGCWRPARGRSAHRPSAGRPPLWLRSEL